MEDVTPAASPPPPPARRPPAWRTLALIAGIGLAPIVASYAFYFFAPRASFTNYGELLATRPLPEFAGKLPDGAPFRLSDLRGRWVMVAAADAGCDAACARTLYAMRQSHTMQGRERERVARVWLATGVGTPPAAVLDEQAGLTVVRVDAATAAALPGAGRAIVLVDPLGNQVLAWPANPDIKGVARDLTRLLKASQIG